MLQVVVILDVKDIGAFKEYERQALSIMRRHQGTLISAFKVKEENNRYREIHILSFADENVFMRYRKDPQLLALSDLRAQAIGATKIYVSESFQFY